MIDILMATYNGGVYIKEQIQSIIDQSYKNWRLVIHDDASSDDTVDKAMDMAQVLARQLREENDGSIRSIQISVNQPASGGPAANFLGLVGSATSEYAMFCDQDDVWHPDKVEKTLEKMLELEEKYGKETPLLVYTDLVVVDAHLKEMAPSFMEYMKLPTDLTLNRALLQNGVTGCTVMMNRALYEKLRLAKDTDKIIMHDHFATLIAVAFGAFIRVEESTIDYRQHGDNSVGAADAKSFAYLWARYRRGKKMFQKDMYNSTVQAGYFYELYKDDIRDEDKKKLIYEYSQLFSKNKLQRVCFYIKNRVLKYGWIRTVMQIIWG